MNPTPLALPPDAIQQLLDRVVYESLAECIDFVGLARLEDMLAMEIAAICDHDVDRAIAIAKQMIDEAWAATLSDARRAFALSLAAGDPCDLCEAEASAARSQARV